MVLQKETEMGLRFVTVVNDNLISACGEENVKYGTTVIKTEYLKSGEELTLKTEKAFNSVGENIYKDNSGNEITLYGEMYASSLYDIAFYVFEQNTEDPDVINYIQTEILEKCA